MILYLDTSSLVKLYLEEAYSDSVRMWVTVRRPPRDVAPHAS